MATPNALLLLSIAVVIVPPVPNPASKVPFGLYRASAKNPSETPAATILPSVCNASADKDASWPIGDITTPPVPKVASSTPVGV